ncbi:MAG: PhzF family phenazine biosynthesis protein [Cyanobacteria bacterium P01_D01_bin.105]
MGLKIVQVDAFTNQPFSGNPAAVCVTEAPLAAERMQAIAAEMNLSETAFLHRLGDTEEEGFSIRWFSPEIEVALCGHATLASAHTLWSEGHLSQGAAAKFKSQSGWLGAQQKEGGWIELDFPTQPVTPTNIMPQLIKSLGCQGDIRTVSKNSVNYLVEVQSEQSVRTMSPDFEALKQLPIQGVIVTAAAKDGMSYDFVSRYFCPKIGINEDPVTGSAHTSLAPYWQAKLSKPVMLAQQISKRGGVIKVDCTTADRVLISGQAITILKGELIVAH